MKRKSLFAVVLLSAVIFAGGCYSRTPMAVNHPITTQPMIRTAQHWELLAEDVAARVQKAVTDREDLIAVPVHVQPAGQSDFAVAFRDLLISQMVSRGMQVSVEEEDTLTLEYKVLTLTRRGALLDKLPPGSFTALGGGILAANSFGHIDNWLVAGMAAGLVIDITRSYFAGFPDSEVVVTTTLARNNRYVMHHSGIYYIPDDDQNRYREHRQQEPWKGSTLRIVDR